MPEQQGRRGNPVTAASFEAPFETPTVRLGVAGVNLHSAVDAIKPEEARRLTNWDHDGNGYLVGRPGITALATLAGLHHSVHRLENQLSGTYTRVWGIGTTLALGATTPAVVETGFSGDPLTLTPARYDQNGLPWMLVADRNQLRRVRGDGQVADLGVRAPSTAASATLWNLLTTRIASFDGTDATTAASWTGTAGTDVSIPEPFPAGAPTAADVTGLSGDAVEFTANPGTAVLGYYSFWGAPIAVDLSILQGSAANPASDDDIVHVWMRMSHPHRITELRIYLVCSDTFSAAVLPGTDQTGVNSDAYVKSFRANDFASFIRGYNSQIEAAETARVRRVRDQALLDQAIRAPRSVEEREVITEDDRASWEDARAKEDVARVVSLQVGAGAQEWTEFGNIGVPLRRGDFQRIGSTPGRNWSTITGIILFVQTNVAEEVAIALDDFFMTGGYGLDTAEPGAKQYDWRYTHVDRRTGSEGNPSPEMEEIAFLDSLRREVQVTPTAYGDSHYYQRFYRRGGSLTDDWYFAGENGSDGEVFYDREADLAIAAAGTLEIDNYEPVPTVNENGETVLAQPVPAIWGPVEDLYFACGDPYRPGHVYFCKPGNPDSWPYSTEVSHPGDPLQAGGLLGGQAFTFSRTRLYWLYPNLTGQAIQVTAAPTGCKKGLAGRWAFCVGAGAIWFVSDDGVYKTGGSGEDLVSLAIDPLFHGESVEGYQPVDYTDPATLRLAYVDQEIWFTYLDTDGDYQTWILDLTTSSWRHRSYGQTVVHVTEDQGALPLTILLGGDGATYQQGGADDAGEDITWTYRSGALDFGRPREDKLFGDGYLDFASAGHELTVQTFLNAFNVANPSQAVTSGTTRARAILDAFGPTPQRGRTLGVEIAGSGAGSPPILYQLGASITPQPDYTVNRVTNWDDLAHPTEKYLTGCVIECDSNGQGRTIVVEGDLGGVLLTIATFDIPAMVGRHKFQFSWAATKTYLVRIRPTDDCVGWLLYRLDWIFDPEPPRISKWDINHENSWDAYYTGLDLECNTFGLTKQIQIYVDQTLVATRSISANGRRVVHLTFGPGRGHVFRFAAIDANPGLLYTHRWHLDAEPSEQTNWNQNFTVAGSLSDKWLKGIVLECDTFGANKSVQVQIDGAVVETLTVNTPDRRVVEFSFEQHLGRVFRLLPVDDNPGRLYTIQWVFDLEPLQITRWETQETDHGFNTWHYLLYAHLTYKATSPVTLEVRTHNQQGKVHVDRYTLPGTGGVKRKGYLQFRAVKGVLFKYLFTSEAAFFLYREESQVAVQPWGGEAMALRSPFGNDDLDPTRGMSNAALAAARPGGTA